MHSFEKGHICGENDGIRFLSPFLVPTTVSILECFFRNWRIYGFSKTDCSDA
jgi:hypothetical protein